MKLRNVLTVALLSISSPALVAATPLSGSLDVRIRDSSSGRAVEARVAAQPVDGRSASSVESATAAGRFALQLSAARYRLFATADGYAPLRTELEVSAGSSLPVTLWLDPAEPAQELREDVVKPQLKAGYALIHGHVFDEVTGAAIANAPVRLESARMNAVTDSRGYFSLQVPTLRFGGADDVPEQDDLVVELSGYKLHAIRNTLLLGQTDTHFIIDLERGSGRTDRDDEHKIIQHGPDGDHPHDSAAAEHSHDSYGPRVHAAAVAAAVQGTTETPGTVQALAITVPDSIRVGFSCSCSSCSSVQVFSMQTYVKRGLNDEWIASWNLNSLRAGAVAYRSFGAWHVAHPKSTNYDICSSTCCQVNDSDTSTATSNATVDTAGIVLVANDEIFRSEYAAENNSWDDTADGKTCSNNDRSCGNGNAGSPAANWPCLPDSVCTGKGCYGHGRGMCQWGSQRWASGQSKGWRWIVNHYYNNNGNPSGLRSAFLNDETTTTTEVIVDNATTGRFTASSNWGTSSYSSQRYGADYRYATPEPISDAAWFKVNVPAAGSYEVYVWYPASTGYNSSTPFVIVTSSGNQTKYVNQQANGGIWYSLGIYSLNGGDYNLVGVSRWTSTAGYVIADAVKIVAR